VYKWIAIGVALVSMIAAILVIPEVRNFFGLRNHSEGQKIDSDNTVTTSNDKGVINPATKLQTPPPVKKDKASKSMGDMRPSSSNTGAPAQNVDTRIPTTPLEGKEIEDSHRTSATSESSFPNSVKNATKLSGAPSREEVESAKQSLIRVFRNLKRTYHHDPYSLTIDLGMGTMTMDNEKVRWECSLGDLDPSTVHARTWYPGGGQRSSRTIGSDCSANRECIDWGESNGLGGYRKPPGKMKGIRFEVYKGEGPNFERDLDAENDAVVALTTLIGYFQKAKR
jgi:peptidoglycan hydrolase-like protein with peptidoglycan-binding domain